eukprot:129712_1
MINSTITTRLTNDNDNNGLSQSMILYIIIGVLICLICTILIAFVFYRFKHEKNKEMVSKFGIQSFKYRKKVPKDVKNAVKDDNNTNHKPDPENPDGSNIELNSNPESQPKTKSTVESKKLEDIIHDKMDDMFKNIPQRNRTTSAPEPYQHQHNHIQQQQIPYSQAAGYVINSQQQHNINNNNTNMNAIYYQQQTRHRAMTQQAYMYRMQQM